jgi:hypothetical protein
MYAEGPGTNTPAQDSLSQIKRGRRMYGERVGRDDSETPSPVEARG